jgi:hypothetical protein
MAAPTLNSVSPASGPPGTEITCLGAGFDAGAQIGCPVLVATEYVSDTELTAVIPELLGEPGQELEIVVYVRNEDATLSTSKTFTVLFDREESELQGYTDVVAVAGEVPGFQRGGQIKDSTIETWIRSLAQTINGELMRRGLPLDPVRWQTPDAATGMPAAGAVLENINRLGAAARLAAAVGSQFGSSESGLAKDLRESYMRELKNVREGSYDKLFRPSAATVETDGQVSVGDIETDSGDAEQAFRKDQVF